jgi:hypothetical protein
MKFSIGLATCTLLFAAAIVDATWPDAAAHKRHAAHVNVRDVAQSASKRCKTRPPGYSSTVQPTNPTPTPNYLASNSTLNVSTNNSVSGSGSQNPSVQSVTYQASGVINVDPGKCSPIGATSLSRQTFVGRRVDLTTVIVSKYHKYKRPQWRY